jgi:ribosomal protein S18 acetylase RimI-like enzyme/SAM-dependent methyltransferase
VSSSDHRVSVRVARLGDEAALARIDAVAWTSASGFPSVTPRADGSFFSAEHPPGEHLVAEVNGTVAGYVRVRPVTPLPENAHVSGIAGLAVAPDARGRGAASALLAAAEQHARDRGARKLSLRVLSTNDAALRLYERLGFRREGTLFEEFLIDGRYVDDVLMAKHLGGSSRPANVEQAEAWNGASGRHFIEQRERHERMRTRLTARLLTAAQIEDGENVLDIGCGCGDTTIMAARATRRGHALGADLSRIQVAEARRLAAAAGVTNASFEVADAQVHPFPAGAFDLVLSNFGLMFFDDPAAAFGNLRKALRPRGRLTFLCWRTLDENPFFAVGFAEAAAVLNLREMAEPSAVFSLASTDRVHALLTGAGFGGIEFAKVDEPMLIGHDLDDVLEYERASPRVKDLLAEFSAAQAAELTEYVRERFAPYASPEGVVMPAAAWLVTAHAA